MLQPVKHVKVRVLEDVVRQVIVHWRDPASVNSEEEAEFLCEVALLDVCTGVSWHPKLLWISL